MPTLASENAKATHTMNRLLGLVLVGCLPVALLGCDGGSRSTGAAASIRIGEINSYSAFPAYTLPYRNGWQLALEEINVAGGVLGRELEVVSRDDGGKPSNALTHASELVTRARVTLLCGTFLSNVGLAMSDFAKQKEVLFIAAETLTTRLTEEQGNRYTWRLRPSTYVQNAMLVAAVGDHPARRWATIAPNYEYGQSSVAEFKKLMTARHPAVEFVEEQWPALGKLDAGATVEALGRANPDAIYNATFGADLAKLVREGSTRGLFRDRLVVSPLTGEPEYLDPLRDEAPEGWLVTGYPWSDIETAEHETFVRSYRAKFGDPPRLSSVVGYSMIQSVAALLRQAGSTGTEALIETLGGLRVDTPLGPISWRGVDHQSTMGAYVGKTARRNGRGIMVEWYYANGADYLPSEEEVLSRQTTGR